jgi:hypothetical protein
MSSLLFSQMILLLVDLPSNEGLIGKNRWYRHGENAIADAKGMETTSTKYPL